MNSACPFCSGMECGMDSAFSLKKQEYGMHSALLLFIHLFWPVGVDEIGRIDVILQNLFPIGRGFAPPLGGGELLDPELEVQVGNKLIFVPFANGS